MTELRIDDYRSGYSAGYSDGRNGEPMRDLECAQRFFGQRADRADDEQPCSVCGCEERQPRTGLLTCECPAPLPRKVGAEGAALVSAVQQLKDVIAQFDQVIRDGRKPASSSGAVTNWASRYDDARVAVIWQARAVVARLAGGPIVPLDNAPVEHIVNFYKAVGLVPRT